MDWANERWVRLYTRDTTTWKMLDWRARTVLMHLMRKVDRAGVLEVGDTGTLGLSAVLELPIEIVEPGLERLVHPRLRVVVETPTAYVIPNFLDAQEAVQTTNHRSAEYRARKRDFALAAAKPAIAEIVRIPVPPRAAPELPPAPVPPPGGGDTPDHQSITPRDAAITARDASVTPHHGSSLLSDPNRSEDPALALPRAIPPSTDPVAPPAPPAQPPRIQPPIALAPQSAWRRRRAWWVAMLEADRRLRDRGIEPNAPGLPPSAAGDNERRLVACEKQLADAGFDAETVDAKMRHIVLVAEEEAKREGHRRWFKPSLIWDLPRAARAADTSLEEAAAPRLVHERAGPRRSAERAPVTGRVTPAAPEDYQTGDIPP